MRSQNIVEQTVPDTLTLSVDQASIELMTAAMASRPFDEAMLTSRPVSAAYEILEAALTKLQNVNTKFLTSRYSWLGRATGADIEARLKFKRQVQIALEQVKTFQAHISNARHVLSALEQTERQLITEQAKLQKLVTAGRDALTEQKNADEILVRRFGERLLSIGTLHTSNHLTLQQIALAKENIISLLDRLQDMERLVFPLWQRDALAIVQSDDLNSPESALARRFVKTHQNTLKTVAGDP